MSILDFSYLNWLAQNSIVDTGKLKEVFVTQLLRELGIDQYMKSPQCNLLESPYQTADAKGWNLESKLNLFLIVIISQVLYI